jgi:HlyD family secretion protein
MNPNTSPGFLKRWGPWGLAALGVVALAVWALMPRPLVVEVGTVHTGRFEQAIDEDGQLRVKNRYVISAPMAAELVRPTLKVGDSVRAGDVVARLTPLAPNMIDERNRQVLQQRVGRDDAARMAAAAQLQRLQTTLTQTELEAQRAQKLASDNFIAAAALDQAVLASAGLGCRAGPAARRRIHTGRVPSGFGQIATFQPDATKHFVPHQPGRGSSGQTPPEQQRPGHGRASFAGDRRHP